MAVGVRYLTVNLADSGTITTDSAVSSLPVTNLQDSQIARPWRAAANSCYLLVDLGSSQSVNFIGLFGCLCTSAVTRRFRISTADSTGAAGDAYDSAVGAASINTALQQLLGFLPATYAGRYVRVDLADSIPPEAGRLVIGLTTTPTRGFQFPVDMLAEDLTQVQETPRGNQFLLTGPVRRVLDFTLPALTEAESWAMLNDELANGSIADILLALDASDATYLHQKTLWGLRKETTPISWRGIGYFGRRWRITERISDSR